MGRELNRRQFISGTAGAGLLAGLGGLAACSPQQAATGVTPASDQGAAVDSIQAADWLGSAPAITDAECVETVDVDVLVVGGGCSGTSAAYFAAEGGAKTMMIEAGENSVYIRSSSIAAVDSRYQQEKNVTINKEDLLNDMTHYALNQCDMSLIRNWLDHSAEAVNWYGTMVEEAGCEILLEYNMPENTRYMMWPTGHGTNDPNNPNKEMVAEPIVHAVIIDHFEKLGGEYRTSTRMQCLIKEGDEVVGAYATSPDGDYIRINAAKGVVVATGGYINNDDMYTALQGELKKSLSFSLNFGTAHGDGIKACLWAGSRMDDIHTTMIFDRGCVTPDTELADAYETGEFRYVQFATQPWLKVTKSGKRICNESSPYDFLVHAAALYPEKAWYPIWDSNWKANVERFLTVGCSTLFLREGSNHHPAGVDGTEALLNGLIEEGFVIQADTLNELAEKLLIDDVEMFKSEVAKHNQWFADQYDAEFGKDPFRLSALDTPPFYGMKVGGLSLCTLDGINVNSEYQALDGAFAPIERLYVIGNDSGSFYANTYPNFGAGTNAGRCVTAGMLVGKTIAQK